VYHVVLILQVMQIKLNM